VFNLDKFAKHITDHGCAYDKADVAAILTKATSCLREQMLAGNKVNLGDLGSFHVELACEGARTTDEFDSSKIKAVNVRWTPGKDFLNLRDEAEFKLVASRKAQDDAIEVIKNEDTIQGLE
jgi:predicted histone-like DNA-binding protein